MAIILNINTAFETASVILSSGSEILFELQHAAQKDHASFLEPAIKTIFSDANISLKDIDAVSVINGPGSYTGLRVGLASAKALCYALQKPLILLNTLDVMALALQQQAQVQEGKFLYCPMIDARRQEVFTALYNTDLSLKKAYFAEILTENFLEKEQEEGFSIICGGNGSYKFEKITNYKKITYINPLIMSKAAILLAGETYTHKTFSDVVYSEPFYLKAVYFKNSNPV